MKNKQITILIFIYLFLLLASITSLKYNNSVNYLVHMNSLISFYIFFLFKWGFICFWLVVVLYNVYKSELKVNMSMYKFKVYVYDCLDKLRKKSLLKSFLSKSKRIFNTIKNVLIRYTYKVFIYSILGIVFPDISFWFYILVNIAITGSYRYIMYTIDQLSDPTKYEKDFSLTSSYMRKTFTLDKFILLIFTILLGYSIRCLFF